MMSAAEFFDPLGEFTQLARSNARRLNFEVRLALASDKLFGRRSQVGLADADNFFVQGHCPPLSLCSAAASAAVISASRRKNLTAVTMREKESPRSPISSSE